MSEANIAEAELAKVIRDQANVSRHEYTRPDGVYDDLDDCAICDESKWDCDRTQALLKHDAKALAAALLAAGYAKRSDVLEECGWLIETNPPGQGPLWLKIDMSTGDRFDFTKESNEALRFARKVDAENWLLSMDAMLPRYLTPTEHIWSATKGQP